MESDNPSPVDQAHCPLEAGDKWRFLTGDSRLRASEVPDGSIEMICTDPPYNLRPYSTGNISAQWRNTFNNDLAEWDGEPFDPAEWRDEFLRVLSPTGNIFAFTNYNLMGRWHSVFDPIFDTFQFMVWHKVNPPPKLRRAGFLNSCELIVCMWNRGHTWNFTCQAEMHNFMESPICGGSERVQNPPHPTQKPVEVMRKLVALATSPGDAVLDPFAGVGSTGVAALQLGRSFVGIEADAAYARAAVRRLQHQTTLDESRLFLGIDGRQQRAEQRPLLLSDC